jgi:hypothetical protein
MTPCLLAAPTSNYLSVASSQVERRCIRQSLGEYYSLGGFCVGRQTLISVLLLFRYFVRACFEIVKELCNGLAEDVDHLTINDLVEAEPANTFTEGIGYDSS